MTSTDFVTVNAYLRTQVPMVVQLAMPAVTAAKYAAKRCADLIGLDDGLPWSLAGLRDDEPVGPQLEPGALYQLYLGKHG